MNSFPAWAKILATILLSLCFSTLATLAVAAQPGDTCRSAQIAAVLSHIKAGKTKNTLRFRLNFSIETGPIAPHTLTDVIRTHRSGCSLQVSTLRMPKWVEVSFPLKIDSKEEYSLSESHLFSRKGLWTSKVRDDQSGLRDEAGRIYLKPKSPGGWPLVLDCHFVKGSEQLASATFGELVGFFNDAVNKAMQQESPHSLRFDEGAKSAIEIDQCPEEFRDHPHQKNTSTTPSYYSKKYGYFYSPKGRTFGRLFFRHLRSN